jgi:hypothetical protein
VIEGFEEKASLETVARGEVDMPCAPREGLDQCEDLVMCQRMRAHSQSSPETDWGDRDVTAPASSRASETQL